MSTSQSSYEQSRQYFNTMVFAAVSGLVSIALLLMVLSSSDLVRRFSVFIITVEVGLVVVIAGAIWRIVAYEQRRSKSARNGYENKLKITTCPDYWTATGNTCRNSFKDPYDPRTVYIINGTAKDSPDGNNIRFIDRSAFSNRRISDACKEVGEKVQAPWTDVTSVCDSYRLSSMPDL